MRGRIGISYPKDEQLGHAIWWSLILLSAASFVMMFMSVMWMFDTSNFSDTQMTYETFVFGTICLLIAFIADDPHRIIRHIVGVIVALLTLVSVIFQIRTKFTRYLVNRYRRCGSYIKMYRIGKFTWDTMMWNKPTHRYFYIDGGPIYGRRKYHI